MLAEDCGLYVEVDLLYFALLIWACFDVGLLACGSMCLIFFLVPECTFVLTSHVFVLPQVFLLFVFTRANVSWKLLLFWLCLISCRLFNCLLEVFSMSCELITCAYLYNVQLFYRSELILLLFCVHSSLVLTMVFIVELTLPCFGK